MMLAEYMRVNHPSCHKVTRVVPEPSFSPEFKMISVKKITAIKAFVLAGIGASAILPPQYAIWVVLVTNGYWMFKL